MKFRHGEQRDSFHRKGFTMVNLTPAEVEAFALFDIGVQELSTVKQSQLEGLCQKKILLVDADTARKIWEMLWTRLDSESVNLILARLRELKGY